MIDPNTLIFILTLLIYSIILGLNRYMNYTGWRYSVGAFFVSMGLAWIMLGFNDPFVVSSGVVWIIIGLSLWLIKGNRNDKYI
jgi:hypothetical protein